MSKRFVLDGDPGIDDCLALLYLLASPGVSLTAVTTTFGNVSVDQATENALNLLDLAGRPDVPVAAGGPRPLCGPFAGGDPEVHGAGGIGGAALPAASTVPVEETAVDALVRLVRESPGHIHLISIGPLTNIALALEAEPRFSELVGSYTLMGGAAQAPGNVSAVAEANIGSDPEAAARVFRAPWQPTIVPLDVTMQHTLELSDLDALHARGTTVSSAVAVMLEHYFDYYTDLFGRRCCALHDPMAVAVALGDARPRVAPRVPVSVDESDGPGRGQLRPCRAGGGTG